jgi:hypothetical protein
MIPEENLLFQDYYPLKIAVTRVFCSNMQVKLSTYFTDTPQIKLHSSQVHLFRYISVILALRRLKQKHGKFKASLGYTQEPVSKSITQKTNYLIFVESDSSISSTIHCFRGVNRTLVA